MTVLEYFKQATLAGVAQALIAWYGAEMNLVKAHLLAALEIMNLKPEDPEGMYIVLRYYGEESTWDVSGHYPEGHEKYEPCGYAIEYIPWAEWLPMRVEIDDFEAPHQPTVDEVVAHLLWEMTWCGYNVESAANRLAEIKAAYGDYEENGGFEEIDLDELD